MPKLGRSVQGPVRVRGVVSGRVDDHFTIKTTVCPFVISFRLSLQVSLLYHYFCFFGTTIVCELLLPLQAFLYHFCLFRIIACEFLFPNCNHLQIPATLSSKLFCSCYCRLSFFVFVFLLFDFMRGICTLFLWFRCCWLRIHNRARQLFTPCLCGRVYLW